MTTTNAHEPPWPATKHTLIYFITGNPGLIAYYHPFIISLRKSLHATYSTSPTFPSFTVHGSNLAGFDDADLDPAHPTPYSLQEQISHVHKTISEQRIKTKDGIREFDNIILIGHSVGAFILMEILKTLRTAATKSDLNIQAGILLFPTITHIAQSPNGLKLTLLLKIPQFEWMMQKFTTVGFWWQPRSVILKMVEHVTGMPLDAADVTRGFLQSRMGVWQALYMARDEMATITEDRWDEDIWGVETQDGDEKEIPKLYFYFGQKDHWVADHVRDELIEARARNAGAGCSSKPKMIIDTDGVPHAFCIKHSELIADKVKLMIDEIVEDK